ncbi:hypothetical protein FS749_012335 [Ceratobasidium sp. UAMH 11750]|nr:hypothetical protein FS749_012335 [Ceratobasidium sp. UAMH 11750]
MINGGRIARLGRPKLLVLGGLTLSLASSLMLPFSAHLHDHTGPSSFPPLSSAQQEPPSSLSSPTLRSSGLLHPSTQARSAQSSTPHSNLALRSVRRLRRLSKRLSTSVRMLDLGLPGGLRRFGL